jgi:flagellar hook protein FlgE
MVPGLSEAKPGIGHCGDIAPPGFRCAQSGARKFLPGGGASCPAAVRGADHKPLIRLNIVPGSALATPPPALRPAALGASAAARKWRRVMGIFGALNTAVGGMRAQSYALQNISGNIANSQTVGFKREDTSFMDLIPDDIPSNQVAGGVIASSRPTNSVQGDIQNATVGTYMAINGSGFFVVEKPASFTDNNPVFDGVDLYTRRGDFSLNKDGYLVNGAGYYLMGIPIDPATGNPVGNVPQLLQFSNGFLPAEATTRIQYQANLPSYPLTNNHDTSTPGSELLDPASYSVDPTVAGTGTVVGDDVTQFLNDSVSGGAITGFDALGAPANIQLRWVKTDSASSGGTDTWNLFYQTDSTAAGTDVAWKNVGVDFKFDASGKMSPAVSTVALSGVTVDGVSLGNVALDLGSNGVTQFSDPDGTVKSSIQQNGFPAGTLQTISVNDKGRIVGTYSNNRTIDLAAISLANFNSVDGLKRIDGGAFAATDDSGPAMLTATGKIVGGALEGSNADIADEFTKLIVTQQAYSANTRVITTSNQMVQDLLNMLR